ncbi:MAG: hypothetical protein ACF8XB_08320 [Planctomycetota bacterium JB042]
MNRSTLSALLLSPLVGLPSCGEETPRGGEIETVRTVERDLDLDATDAHRFRYDKPADPFLHDAPASWREVPPAQFRDLNFVVPGADGGADAECYVSILQGGSTLENINRWRRQMSLEPFTDEELAALPIHDVVGRKAVLVDVEGTFRSMAGEAREGARLLGVYAAFPAFGLSVKMIGDAPTVAAHRDGFVRFAESLALNPERFGGAAPAADPPTTPPAASAPAGPREQSDSGLSWVAPGHWEVGSGSSMRAVTYDVPGKEGAQCWVTVLGGQAGGVLANVNRWRREVGEAPLGEADLDSLPHLHVLGRDSVFLDVRGSYQGMSGAPIEEARLYGVVCDLGDSLLFVKMVGRAADLEDERSHFIAFCESLST